MPLVYCTSCPLARERLHCRSIVSSLGSPFQRPRFALYTVPTHCLAPWCPLSQTGMTLGTLPAAQVEMSGGLAAQGSDKQIAIMSDRGGGRSRKALEKAGAQQACDVTWSFPLASAARHRSARDTEQRARSCREIRSHKLYSALTFSPPCRSVRDERSHHLHGDESGLGAGDGLLRLLLHPGVGRLPFGADQWTHLRHLEEARMSRHSIPVFPVTPSCPTASVISPPLKFKF